MTVLITIIIFSILIVVHEFGHFLAAKLAGVRVEKFAIGFGPALLKIKGKETQFLICLFPFGGYVKLAGDERSQCKGLSHEFFSKPIGVRARIVFFGPLFNIILAFFIFWMIFIFAGFPSPEPVVGEVGKFGAVAKDKFTQEELQILTDNKLIVDIDNGKKYALWVVPDVNEKTLEAARLDDKEIKGLLAIWNGSARITPKSEFSERQLKELTIKNIVDEKVVYWSVDSQEKLEDKLAEAGISNTRGILDILEESREPAYRAGIKKGDRILAVNGQTVKSWKEMSSLIRESKEVVHLTILRDGKEKKITAVPKQITIKDAEGEKTISRIGITSEAKKANAFACLLPTCKKMYYSGETLIKGIISLFTKRVSFKEAVGGPIAIGFITSEIVKVGMIHLFEFVGILSIMLAIINLFPFPVLDGGHLLFMGIEKIRRKPVSQKLESIITQVAIGLLLTLMLFVSYNDILNFVIKKPKFSREQLKILEEKGIVREVRDDAKYAFWANLKEDELTSRLSKIEDLNSQDILTIWRASPKVTEVVVDEEDSKDRQP